MLTSRCRLTLSSSDQRIRNPFQTPYVYAGISNHRGLRISASFCSLHNCDPRLLVTNLTSTIETFLLGMNTWARVCLVYSNNLPANRDLSHLDRRSQTKLPLVQQGVGSRFLSTLSYGPEPLSNIVSMSGSKRPLHPRRTAKWWSISNIKQLSISIHAE